MNLLALDTSTATLSVAVSRKDGGFFEINQHGELNHGEKLLPLVELVMTQAQMAFNQLNGIVCTVGPGSFTGIRIGISAANAIAMAQNLPVWGLSTLEAMAWNARHFEGVILATLDAQRGQFYRGFYTSRTGWRCVQEDGVVSREELLEEIRRYGSVLSVGEMAAQYRVHEEAVYGVGAGGLLLPSEKSLGIPEADKLKLFLGDEEVGRIRASSLCHMVREKNKTQAWPAGYAAAVYHRQSQAEVQLELKLAKAKGESKKS